MVVAMVEALRLIAIGELFLTVGFMLGLMTTAWQYIREHGLYGWNYHIYGLGIPYCLFALGAAGELQLRLHSPATWRTPLYIITANIGFFSQAWMWWLWKHTNPEGEKKWLS